MERLRRMGYWGALVGPEGAGKTTLLESLEPRLARVGFNVKTLRLDQAGPKFPTGFLNDFFAGLSRDDAVLFDGAEQMGRLAWLNFKRRARRAGSLVVSAHQEGWLPTLHRCGTSAELLEAIVTDLLPESGGLERARIQSLFLKHEGNLRLALRELYDDFARLEAWS